MRRLDDRMRKINYLTAETEELYHRAAVRLGLSDSAMRVLYILWDRGGVCPLGEICRQSGISKQTVNSALRKLEAAGILYLTQSVGRSKHMHLTPEGEAYTRKTVARLFAAETDALSDWTETEIDTHIGYLEKYLRALEKRVETL